MYSTDQTTATAQDIFEFSARHMLAQRMQSLKAANGRCAYRGENGRACAVGCLLTDDEASELDTLDNSGVRHVAHLLPARLAPHLDLLHTLQRAHDGCLPSDSVARRLDLVQDMLKEARRYLSGMAATFGLDASFLQEIP